MSYITAAGKIPEDKDQVFLLTKEELKTMLNQAYCEGINRGAEARTQATEMCEYPEWEQLLPKQICLQKTGNEHEENTQHTISEKDIYEQLERDMDFRNLFYETQRILGRSINTAELRYLHYMLKVLLLPQDVIAVLICFCKDNKRNDGYCRRVSMSEIKKEAVKWANMNINSLEKAAVYIQEEASKRKRVQRIQFILNIKNRNLVPFEENRIREWISAGFDDHTIQKAYEICMLRLGKTQIQYINAILNNWAERSTYTGNDEKDK